MKTIIAVVLAATLSFLISGCSTSQQDKQNHLVLTSVAPVYQLTLSLTEGTDISVLNLPDRPRSMASQPTFFSRQGENFSELFQKAGAVITIGNVWQEDPLFTTARQYNIRIVNIDASQPYSYERSGVALARSPVSGEISPYFWTSTSNVIRMLEIIAWDLNALFPEQQPLINCNLNKLKSALLTLKSEMESRFISEVDDPVIYALTDDFINLTNEIGLFVDGYTVKQDIDWSDEDLENLTRYLKENQIKVVIHKWEPDERIIAAIDKAGTHLLVLDNLEITEKSITLSLNNNVNSIIDAFGNLSQ